MYFCCIDTNMNCKRCGTWLAGDHVEEEQKFAPDGSLNVHTDARCADRLAAILVEGRVRVNSSELKRQGGEWLGAARSWLQWHRRNGDSVAWGSTDVLEPPFTVADVEDLASEVASAAMRPQPTEERIERCLKARWIAEHRVSTLEIHLKETHDACVALKKALDLANEGDNPHWYESSRDYQEAKRIALALSAKVGVR